MKLPPEYRLTSLEDLRDDINDGSNGFAGQLIRGDTLEMSTEQYIAYKRLVWESDPIKRFEGMEIVIPKAEPKSPDPRQDVLQNSEDDKPIVLNLEKLL